MEKSTKVYLLLIIILAVCSSINIFLPQGTQISSTPLPASKPVMALAIFALFFFVYGGLGFLGLYFSNKLGFAKILDKNVSNKQRLVYPLLIGVILGIFLIILDVIFSNFNGIGKINHPPFPTSIFASISAGIGEEIIFRLFFISFWTWLISSVILKKRHKIQVFWIVSSFSAIVFALGHLPTLMILYNLNISQISPSLYIELILMNGLVSMFAAYCMRKYGFLTAVGIHFWTDIVWHAIYGLI